MTASAVTKFLTELSLHFGKRFESDEAEDQWLDSMERNLRVYTPSVLERACKRIVDTRKDRYFPLPAECRAACEDIVKIEEAEKAPLLREPQHKFAGHADWQYRRADELIMIGPLGKQAAREGWILSLHDFIRENGRLPTSDLEVRKCKDAARGFDEAYERLLRNGGVLSPNLIALGDAMLKRRESLRARVMGREG
jgi:hypothetical protein